MNADNNNKAIIVYSPPQRKRFSKISVRISLLSDALKHLFIQRRRVYIAFYVVFALFFWIGNLLTAFYSDKLVLLLSCFLEEYSMNALLAVYLFVFSSGYTIFGRILSVCFFAVLSTVLGIYYYPLIYVLKVNFLIFIALSAWFSILVFINSVFCTECFSLYCRFCNNKLIFNKRSLYYILLAFINFYNLYLFFTNI